MYKCINSTILICHYCYWFIT